MTNLVETINNGLVNSSRFKRKISFLRENSHLATSSFDTESYSNCMGTTAFAIGIDRKLKEHWESLVKKEKVIEDTENCVVLPSARNRPGYIGIGVMETYLQDVVNAREVDEMKAKDGIVGFYFNHGDDSRLSVGLQHTAIYLGGERMFQQWKRKGEFKLSSLAEYVATISQEVRKALKIRFFQPEI